MVDQHVHPRGQHQLQSRLMGLETPRPGAEDLESVGNEDDAIDPIEGSAGPREDNDGAVESVGEGDVGEVHSHERDLS